ncbi:MAG TPA: hypothetical protein VFF06_28895 [Polyangia bacterium]|nr:hypothetical protein [Polyangia bacterium]
MRRLALALLPATFFAAIILAARAAPAQPMMVDPSRMSGIPRPDPQVPPKTVTVRLIRGELANRVTGHDVELIDQASGKKETQKTDEQGRATFSNLQGGPYVAHAVDRDEEKVSQPIELQPNVGTRVMLVFSAGGLGQPDGVGHADKSVPPGTVLVRVVGDGGEPLAGLDVIIGQARAGEQGVVEHKAKTDAKGEAKFAGLDSKPTSGYLVEALKDGSRFSGKPFRLSENMGALVVLEVRPISKDLSQLSIGAGSHLIMEIGDDSVQVVEVLALQNSGTAAVDVGPGGLHLPLPEKAVSATVGPQTPPALAVQGHEAIWRGPIPPGETQLQILFVLAYQGDQLDMVQPTPVPFADLAIVTEKIDGLSLERRGVGRLLTHDSEGKAQIVKSTDRLEMEERQLQGRTLRLYRGAGTEAGGYFELALVGLPHSDPTWRLLAAAAALAIVLAFVAWAYAGPRVSGDRARLEQRREHLLEELAALDARGDADPKRARKREELAEKLAKIYRELDEVSL